ncbi:chaperone modulator CbpM [Cytophaga aurantiaca]|uniref:chaperone modulator CbpM n=1 Tax=Cytophaga aurantiaca TaxID=29530 RepID=UPI0003790228|nr:chaperone modulator CbpM [Cytophaga aurantiaca]
MNVEQFIPVHTICTSYQIEVSFLHELNDIGLVEINIIEEIAYVHQDQIRAIEKMIRLHHDLDVNIEGIDVVFNLLNKLDALQTELAAAKRRLRIYEN